MNTIDETPKAPKELTDVELHDELCWTRQQIDAIRPYRFRALELRKAALWREYDARRVTRQAAPDTAGVVMPQTPSI